MRILVLGGDGYLGWPTAMHLAAAGHEVLAVDNYMRRRIASETASEALIEGPLLPERAELFRSIVGPSIATAVGDLCDYEFTVSLFDDFAPDAVIHYAEQPSAPYSMMDHGAADLTLHNNLSTTLNVVWALLERAADCHLVKLGTMGEYGTPDIDIEEGWIDIEHKGRSDRFLFPRAAGSLYHTTKVMDTDLLWFYVRTHQLRVTDLMQGPVYGIATEQSTLDDRFLPNFHYDDIFGTVLNRFCVQAVAGIPLTVYGAGGQTRGYLNLVDTLRCVELSCLNPPAPGELRILNQFTETFSVNELAAIVQSAGKELDMDVQIKSIPNPRKEREEHYYNPAHTGLLELGLEPHLLTVDVAADLIQRVQRFASDIDPAKVTPRVVWNKP